MLVDRNMLPAVQACGYEPFNIRIMGDHRGVYVDLLTRDLFGSETLPLSPIALRDYCLKNIHQTVPFIQEQHQHLEDHAWFQQIKDLQQCIDDHKPNHTLANKLDRRRIAACQHAGSKLKRYGPTPYSPALIKQKTICQLLKIAMNRWSNGMIKEEIIEDIKQKLQDMGIQLPEDHEGCKQVKKAQTQELKRMMQEETQNNAKRQEFHEEMITKASNAGDKERAQRIQRIQRAEVLKAVWTKCAAARGCTKASGISTVMVPTIQDADHKTCTDWKTIEDPKQVTEAITNWLQEHFRRAQNCT
jgi:hypothetical protein